jgi:hypothetical protein
MKEEEGAAPLNSGGADDAAGGTIDLVARESLRTWAKSILGAPRRLDRLVYLLKQEEEDFVRVATEIHRRELVEQRAPAAPDAPRRPAAMFMDPRSLDPWSITPDELRRLSEHVDACAGCQGTGASACVSCGASGQTPCATCGGAGRAQASGAQCALCGGHGRINCPVCSARGMISCSGCSGSGLQAVWLTFTQDARLDVRLVPQTALSNLYPQLVENRILTRSDLAPFVVHVANLASGAIGPGALPTGEHERLATHGPAIDPRLERVSQQQYVRFGAVRRELGFEMVGMRGRIVLAGARCAVEAGPDALRPIRLRLAAWVVATVLLALVMTMFYFAVRGPVPYARGSNVALTLLFLMATIAGSAMLGALLRMVGLHMRLQRPLIVERVYPLLFAVTIGLVFVVRALARPSVAQARAAIDAKDASRAAIVIDALEATGADPDELGMLRDELDFLQVQALAGDARLARLDELASQGGVRAADCARLARDERIQRVRAMVQQGKLAQAFELSDQLFLGADKEAPEVMEVRALVFDTEYAQCGADPCRYIAARKAEKANPTADRKQRTRALHTKLSMSLDIPTRAGDTPLQRLVRARELDATAKAVAPAAGGEQDLEDKVKAAQRWVETERRAVPLLGSDRAVVEELVGKLEEADGKLRVVVQGVAVYVVMDPKRDTCSGVYIVGETKDARQQGLQSELLPSLFLAKALGQRAEVKKPADHPPTARGPTPTETSWKEGSVPVTARWRDGVFVELRVADANPGGPMTAPRPSGAAKAIPFHVTAFPGGAILFDNVVVGKDAVALHVRAGKHEIKVKNRFLGDEVHPVEVKEGQNEDVVIVW